MGSLRAVKKFLQVAMLALPVITLILNTVPVSALVSNPAPSAKISFTFDDGYDSALTQAAPTLAKYGLTGVDYIPTACVGSTGTCQADTTATYLTWDQVTALQSSYGWEIGNHTNTHADMSTLTDAQKDAQLSQSQAAFAAHGITPTDFASPEGDYDNSSLAYIAKYFASHRGFKDQNNNIWPQNDYLLNDMQVQAGVTVAQVQAKIDTAIANKQWLILTFHDIKVNASTNPAKYQYKTADLDAIASYVKSKQTAGQVTASNVNKGLVTSDTNMFANSSFDNGITNGWTTNDPATVKLDTARNGSYNGTASGPTNAISFTSGANSAYLSSPKVAVSNTQTYMFKSFLNVTARTAGEIGYYVDEYDASGNWISGQWKKAENSSFVETMNFTYAPSSANVKKASLQVYVTGNSGIKAYVDNFQMFSLQDVAPPPPATNNLLPNSDFAHGIADGWTTNNATAYAADANNHGSPENPQQAIKLTAGTANSYLFAPQVNVQTSSTYTVSAYLNLLTRSSGEVAFYIDEYDASGAWISGQYAYAKNNVSAETISFSYTPTSANVKKAGLQVILVGNSGITGYLDNAQFLAPSGETPPPPPPVPTNLMPNSAFDDGLATGWTTNDPVNITADSTSNGSPENAVNSIKLLASTQNRHLFSPQIAADATKTYTITSFLKLQQITSGEVGFYIDEYNASGAWISGQYKTGVRSVSTGDVSFNYTPSSAAVGKASLQVIVVANSGIQAYLDNVRWFQN